MEKTFEFFRIYKNKIVASIIFGGITIMLFWGVYFFNTMKAKADSIEFNDEFIKEEVNNVEKTTASIKKIKVDIKGEVNKPGVYELEEDNRVVEKTTTNMIQKTSPIFVVNPLISKEI